MNLIDQTAQKNIQHCSFSTALGCTESFLIISTSSSHSLFSTALAELDDTFYKALCSHGISIQNLVSARIYISDIENQKKELLASGIFQQLTQGAISIIQQPPLSGGPIALFAYFVSSPELSITKQTVFPVQKDTLRITSHIQGRHYAMLAIAGYAGIGSISVNDQTTELFTSYVSLLKKNNMTLPANSIRTWIYVRDVDRYYMGMVKARREFFEKCGLTQSTRFLASTGIGGNSTHAESLVTMDALAFSGLKPQQIIQMEALEHMPPTMRYGVTFERGLRIVFGDRSHLYISGTASIDKNGDIVHPGDPIRQIQCTLANVTALLQAQNATLADLTHLIVYIRDPQSAPHILPEIQKQIPANVPVLAVNGAVCRPGWLVEVDGMAIIKDSSEFKPFL
jgi:enamine deaminase RidA (YjgF/YER057c/UK114 family)